jgi:hypothetical protein
LQSLDMSSGPFCNSAQKAGCRVSSPTRKCQLSLRVDPAEQLVLHHNNDGELIIRCEETVFILCSARGSPGPRAQGGVAAQL